MSALGPRDTIATTHRGHGHVIAKGIGLERFFKEVMGRANGICAGRGGSMHVADMSVGVLGANGIVGAGIPIAVGSALGHKLGKTNAISSVFFGDGSQSEGVLHESLNLSSLWRLPILFVCENNGWSEFSPTSRQFAGSMEALARAFGLAYSKVDGNDVEAVALEAETAVESLRNGGMPHVLECMTTRGRGHFEGDPQKYRDPKELSGLEAIDPIPRAARKACSNPGGDSALRAIEERVASQIEEAVRSAMEDELPDFRKAIEDVYTKRREA
ncbi:MAG: thiamine pyrophosphate-dependent dehydrogenase E1 component subunit alpha, partial [Limisphaerales bacterium]